jgi:hypothetical protein
LFSPREESKERSTTYEKVAKVVQKEMAGRGLKEKIMAGKRFEKIWRENEFKKWRENKWREQQLIPERRGGGV